MALALTDLIRCGDLDVASSSRGPAVEDGILRYTSASAIQVADACEQKFRFKYVDRIPDDGPSGPQQLGTQIDEQVGHYIATGQNALGPLASLGVERKLLPLPGKGVYSQVNDEEAAVQLKAAGVRVVWAIDILDSNERRVIDVKTSSDPVKWGATPKDLLDPTTKFGTQMIIYGKAIWEQSTFRAAVPLTLEHITFKTKGAPDVFHTAAQTTFGEVAERFKVIESRVERMKALAAGETPAKNPETCWAYGRQCPYFDRCHSLSDKLLAGFANINRNTPSNKEKTMGLFSQMKNNALPPGSNTTPNAEEIARLATPKAVGVVPLDAAKDASPAQLHEEIAEGVSRLMTTMSFVKHEFDFDKSTPVAHTCTCGGFSGSPNAFARHLQEKNTLGIPAPSPAGEEPPPPPVGQSAVESSTQMAPKKRGRPAKLPTAATALETLPPKAEAPQAPAAVGIPSPKPEVVNKPASGGTDPSPASGAPDAPKPQSAPPARPTAVGNTSPEVSVGAGPASVRLFINCIQPGIALASLVPYVEERQASILAALKLSPDLDLRFVDSKPLAFAGWKGALAMGVKSQMPPPGDYGVYTGAGDERLDVVVAALEGILPAGAVTKAVR